MTGKNMRNSFHYLRMLDGQGAGSSSAGRRGVGIANGLEHFIPTDIEEQGNDLDAADGGSWDMSVPDDFSSDPDEFDTYDDALDAEIEGEFGSFFGE